jgi:UDP-N-acetylglucosamine diphosphorylase / glucose-1-phosphate thymidylyltransferase / UDP-N-acetylgalactosamine diphosphorylase / glucosamine-1-phosphate N-acetyltransferase / galactosamine-1-phosphate N-acetyltransferase
MLKPGDFFDLKNSHLKELFYSAEYVWDGLRNIKEYLKNHLASNVSDLREGGSFISMDTVIYNGEVIRSGFAIDASKKLVLRDGKVLEGASIICAGAVLADNDIHIGNGNIIEAGVLIKGPTIIGDNNEIRQGAYIRGNVIVGNDCVVGHTTEMKTAVMLGGSKAGHFAYIGDSILGRVNLGAGTKLANLKMIESKVILTIDGKKYETGLRKFGAILADGVETGCNSVTAPGTLLSRNVLLYPNSTARGFYPADTIIKLRQVQEVKERK